MEVAAFQKLLHAKGHELYREMPWRADTRPYYVLVSELMLQQTQVPRVIPKFETFVVAFPDEQALARASLADVLRLWQGLGYNRRAKYLHDAATMIVGDYDGALPDNEHDLLRLPGVGTNTAGAILAYAFNQPSLYVETNIRTVYLHHFFADRDQVTDREIVDLLEKTLDRRNPRKFYQALMDYGAWLKANEATTVTRSRHYKKQSKLEGSLRQMRGEIIRFLTINGATKLNEMPSVMIADERFTTALSGLVRDGLVTQTDDRIDLTK